MQETLVPRVNRHVQVEGAFVLVQDIISSKTVEAELVSHRNHFVDVVAAHTRDLVAAKDAAEAVNVAKGEIFLVKLSHELRTPMPAISRFAKMGVDRAVDAPRDKPRRIQERPVDARRLPGVEIKGLSG